LTKPCNYNSFKRDLTWFPRCCHGRVGRRWASKACDS